MNDVVHCKECGMGYVSSIASDRRQHDKVHRQMPISYEQTLATGQSAWTSRPAVENSGVYRALNEMNPNLKGFRFYGLSDAQIRGIVDGSTPLTVGISNGGDGHDRHGEWGAYTFSANWRAGTVRFELLKSTHTISA